MTDPAGAVVGRGRALLGGTRAAVLAVLLALSSSSAWGQTLLPDLSLEDLMKLDGGQVFGASERLQPALEAPASVSFITAAEIAQHGYRTLADILRSVRGMYVTDDRSFSLIGTRGFAKPGDYNNRILLLINGHRVNDNIFGQAEIGAEFGLDAAMFQRVEVIRGPASSLYGDSAFFAVVNVITRTGASLRGGTVTVETGSLGTRLLRASVGRGFSNGVDLALSGTYEHTDGVGRLYFPTFDDPSTNHGVAEDLDGENIRQVYGRLAFWGLTVTGAYGSRQKDIPTGWLGTVFNAQDPPAQTTNGHGLLDGEYRRSVRGTRVMIRASVDRVSSDATLPYSVERPGVPALVAYNSGTGTRWNVGGQLARAVRGRQTVITGVEFIDNVGQDQAVRYSGSPAPVFDSRRSSTQRAAYLQDEIRLRRWLIVNAGVRYDGYEQFGRFTPRAAVILLPSSVQSVKYLYGSAFRAPNAYELNTFLFGRSVEQLQPESVSTHELVWERYINNWLRTSTSTYWYRADRLITATPDPSLAAGYSFVNQGRVRARGLELEAQMRLRREARALVSYAVQSAVDQETSRRLPNSPRHLAKARISVPGPSPRSFISAEAQYLSSRSTVAGSTVPGQPTVNLTISQPLGRRWELFGGARNLLDATLTDPASSQHTQDVIPQNGRTLRIGLRWHAWGPT